jgi:hypothetical protein
MFFKIIDKYTVVKTPRPLKIEGKDVFTTSEEIHNEQGYFRVENAEYPNDDKAYRPIYKIGEGAILQEWEEIPSEAEEECS